MASAAALVRPPARPPMAPTSSPLQREGRRGLKKRSAMYLQMQTIVRRLLMHEYRVTHYVPVTKNDPSTFTDSRRQCLLVPLHFFSTDLLRGEDAPHSEATGAASQQRKLML